MIVQDIGALVREARLRSGLGQAELARRAATTQTYVSRVERGATTPSLSTLERLLGAMGLRLRVVVEAVPPGNSSVGELRRDFLASTVDERLEDAMTLSRFVTELSISSAGGGDGTR